MSIVLTGDRPTGPLHLGHYIGSLKNRLDLQHKHQMYIMIADTQALTDYFDRPQFVRDNIWQIAQDYLAIGLDACDIFIQSTIKALPELTMYYMNLVTLARVTRNPTVKAELKQKASKESFEQSAPCGFVCYPISQAADITCVQAELIPVGIDQLPMIEQANEIVRKFNSMYKTDVLKESQAILSETSRLIGIDGNAKASKSLNNCIFLIDSPDVVKQKVMSMYTDPNHIRVSDPGNVKNNVVFHYLEAFYEDKEDLAAMKAHYKKGGLGDVTIKQKLIGILENILEPIRERRSKIKQTDVEAIVYAGCKKASKTAHEVLYKVKEAMHLNFDIN